MISYRLRIEQEKFIFMLELDYIWVNHLSQMKSLISQSEFRRLVIDFFFKILPELLEVIHRAKLS